MKWLPAALCFLPLISVCLMDAYNKITMGPFDVVLNGLEECSNIGEGKIRFSFKIRRPSRGEIYLDANTSHTVTIDDSVSFICNFAQFTNGGWKDNFLVKEFPHICSTLRMMVPDLMKKLSTAAGYPKGDPCPISPKNYTLKNFKAEFDFHDITPVFQYSKFRGETMIMKNKKLIGCYRLYVDTVPKRRTGKNKKGRH